MGSHSVTCHPAEVWIPPLPQPRQALDLATTEECKAELAYVTWKQTGWDLNPRPVNRESNALPQRQHATHSSDEDVLMYDIKVLVRASISCIHRGP